MARKRQPYKTYTQEFKLEALRRMEQSNRPASEIAIQLGIRRNQLYKWKEPVGCGDEGTASFVKTTATQGRKRLTEYRRSRVPGATWFFHFRYTWLFHHQL